MKRRWILIILFIGLSLVSLMVGVSNVTIKGLISLDKAMWFLIGASRLPRTITIILTAIGLSISGLILQTITNNKFVSPDVVGVTDSAKLGLIIGVLMFGSFSLQFRLLFAFMFAVIGSIGFIFILRRIKFKNDVYVPLVGLMFGAVIQAVVTFIAYQFNLTQVADTIGIGSFTTKIQGQYELLYVIVIPIVIGFIYMVQFNIIGLGEDFSKNLGINYKKVMAIGLVIVSLITAAIFVVVGNIPFVGLVVPNLVSLYYGDNTKKTSFDVALFGSVFVLAADILSRVIIYPYEMPVSVTMGITGSIIFLFLIYRRSRYAK
ncbi:MAG: iron chelate uptake ABC transporter family permease subunit [Acholeplasmataceae bacterium]|nr:iron chelate uptake ABC transporter family permease subunit [Acholeplasmataceae bacterium]